MSAPTRPPSRLIPLRAHVCRAWLAPLAVVAGAIGCATDPIEPPGAENQPPSVRITGGVTEGGTASYRAELFWFGTDVDGLVDHFEFAIDEGAWTRTDQYSGTFDFSASTPTDGELSEDWHRFDVRAVDNEDARSQPASRAFNAVTVAPTVDLLGPVPTGADGIAEVSNYVRLSWTGRDEDASTANRKPVGYQLKMVALDTSFQSWHDVRQFLLHHLALPDTSSTARSNLLIPETLSVPFTRPLPSEAHFRRTDWWPKPDAPIEDEEFVLRAIPRGDYAVAVRAVDEAGAVTPYFLIQRFEAGSGNIVKLDVGTVPVHPHLTVTEESIVGSKTFTANGEVLRAEVPVNLPLDFRWVMDASWYGAEAGTYNFALDIPDPDCEVCTSSDGIGGWIGWGQNTSFQHTFFEADAGETHTLHIRARDASGSPDREIMATIILDVITFSFDRAVAWVDDFHASGINDCVHDGRLRPWLEAATAPYRNGEPLYTIDGRNVVGCTETTVREQTLAELGRYRLLLWNVAPATGGSGLEQVTHEDADTGSYLRLLNRGGQSLILWGRQVAATLANAYYGGPLIPDDTFHPGCFLYDVLRFRTRIDRVRGDQPNLLHRCSGIVGLEPSPEAIELGLPLGVVDPTGYDPARQAIWRDGWSGLQNPQGGLAEAFLSLPALQVSGMDTLYTMIPNAWAHERVPDPETGELVDLTREVCGSRYGSPLDGGAVVVRYAPQDIPSGRMTWIGTPLHQFGDAHGGDVTELLRRLVAWSLHEE